MKSKWFLIGLASLGFILIYGKHLFDTNISIGALLLSLFSNIQSLLISVALVLGILKTQFKALCTCLLIAFNLYQSTPEPGSATVAGAGLLLLGLWLDRDKYVW